MTTVQRVPKETSPQHVCYVLPRQGECPKHDEEDIVTLMTDSIDKTFALRSGIKWDGRSVKISSTGPCKGRVQMKKANEGFRTP
jgi:hypothetical protein